jgi:hypothetical protein
MDGPYQDGSLTEWLPIGGDGPLWPLGLSLIVLLPAGFIVSRLLPGARGFALIVGGLFSIAFLGFEVLSDGFESGELATTIGKTAILAGAVVGCLWLVIPFIYPFFRFAQLVFIWLFQKPPHRRISFTEPFRRLFSAISYEFDSMKQGRRQRQLLSKSDKQRRQQESDRTRQQIYAFEQEARETLQELLGDRSIPPSPHPNAQTQIKWLQKAREKVRLDYADDPVALGEAMDRIDDEIKGLEPQFQLIAPPPTIDLPLLDAAIARHPKNAALYIERGNYYLNSANDSHKALTDFNHSLLLLPGNAAAHHALGTAYLSCQQTRKGVFHFREALQADPDFVPAQEKLAELNQTQHSGLSAWIGKLFNKSREG